MQHMPHAGGASLACPGGVTPSKGPFVPEEALCSIAHVRTEGWGVALFCTVPIAYILLYYATTAPRLCVFLPHWPGFTPPICQRRWFVFFSVPGSSSSMVVVRERDYFYH